jgi:hypothetical protein
MCEIREMTDARELTPIEMAGVEGGYWMVDGTNPGGPWVPDPFPNPVPIPLPLPFHLP